MSTVFEAKYPGRCMGCDEPIEVGDLLAYDDDHTVVHAGCREQVTRKAIKPPEICPRCFTTKAVNGTCGGCE